MFPALLAVAGIWGAAGVLGAGCASTIERVPEEDGGALDEDAGSSEDGGAEADGGSAEADGGNTEADGGNAEADGGPEDAGRADAGFVDGGRADGGLADAGRADGGLADGGCADGGLADGGLADAGPPSCGIPVGTTRCGASKLFEVSEGTGPSAFDFAAGRTLFLATEVTPAQGDLYLLSLELAPTSPGAADAMSLVAPRDSATSGGERGVLRQTGIEDLSLDGGGPDPTTFTALPPGTTFRAATRGTAHRVPIVLGHLYGLQLNLDADGGPSTYAAMIVDRVVTPSGDGGVKRQWVEVRWLLQTEPGRRTFDRGFPPKL